MAEMVPAHFLKTALTTMQIVLECSDKLCVDCKRELESTIDDVEFAVEECIKDV